MCHTESHQDLHPHEGAGIEEADQTRLVGFNVLQESKSQRIRAWSANCAGLIRSSLDKKIMVMFSYGNNGAESIRMGTDDGVPGVWQAGPGELGSIGNAG